MRSRLLPAEVSILVVLSSHLRAAVNNLSEQVEAKMHRDREKPSSCTGEEKHCVPSLTSVPAVIAVFNGFRYESCTKIKVQNVKVKKNTSRLTEINVALQLLHVQIKQVLSNHTKHLNNHIASAWQHTVHEFHDDGCSGAILSAISQLLVWFIVFMIISM